MSDDTLEILSYVLRGDPERFDAMCPRVAVTAAITQGSLFEVVSETIHFHGDARLPTVEIEHYVSKRVLASEVQSFRPQTQYSPEPDLGWAHSFAKLAGLADGQ